VRRNRRGLAIVQDERALTYDAFNRWANRIAHYLLSLGLKRGDCAVIMLENRPELLAVVTACAKIGVVGAMINTAQRDKVLVHSINLVQPKLAIVGEELLSAFQEVENELVVPKNRRFFVADLDTLRDTGHTPEDWFNLAELSERQPEQNLPQTREIRAEDPLFYIYTSGTTGMPKAVIFNHGRFLKAYGTFGVGVARLRSSDRLYVCLPFYHATAMAVCWGSVLAGNATLIMARKFSASRFWEELRQSGATAFGYVGELCRYLLDQPESPQDRKNRVRLIMGNGLRPSIWRGFKRRFGIDRVIEFYASSEGNIGFSNILNFDNTVGMSPMPYAIVKYDKENEVPIRDSKGFMIKVGRGESGLLIGEITDKTPFHGYTDPAKTEQAVFRNVFRQGDAWFNSGDLMKDMGFKHAQFVDRIGDTFRWKGENVSTTEVEHIFDANPEISETVVYGVEIPDTNGRAGMASIRLNCSEQEFDFTSLVRALNHALPHYAVPVFLRLRKDMETTGTFKHKKAPLKEEGFDLKKIKDPVYVLLPKAESYVKLTAKLQKEIESGKYRY
jgi:citronellyl-CoA synthetase